MKKHLSLKKDLAFVKYMLKIMEFVQAVLHLKKDIMQPASMVQWLSHGLVGTGFTSQYWLQPRARLSE